MQQKGPVTVLIAPLDWGLGHATRCVPIINELVDRGARVIIAASGSQKSLLMQEFPLLEFHDIPGYEIRYKKGVFLKYALLFAVPFLLKQIRRENKWLSAFLEHRRIDAVISDNRYGLHHPHLYSVFITHQLAIRTGLGTLFDWILLKWNYALIRKFSACWVPDNLKDFSFAGKLSHPPQPPTVPVKYIGILSRLKFSRMPVEKNSLLVLLSGPEPARTCFEKKIFSQLKETALKTFVVRGLPGSDQTTPFIRSGVVVYNHLPSAELNELLNRSEFILTRAGYSSIMDLAKLKKNALLIPTRGQTEQEYLGSYLHEKKWMVSIPEKKFKLGEAIRIFQQAELVPLGGEETSLYKVLEEFLNTCIDKKR